MEEGMGVDLGSGKVEEGAEGGEVAEGGKEME